MRPRRSGFWHRFRLCGALLLCVVACAACGGGGGAEGPQSASSRPATGASECVDAPPKRDLCDILVSHFSRCTTTSMPRQHLVDDCQNTWSGFATRANACFTAELSECLSAPCERADVERCFRLATVGSDPDSFSRGAEACVSQGECDGDPGGWLSRCEARFEECGAFEDVCKTAVSLQRRHRSEVDACFSAGCEGLEDCVYRALGQL